MLRKYHRFMLSATVLVGLVWVLALVLLLSQQQATPEVMPTAVAALPSETSPTAEVMPKTPLPVASPVAPDKLPPSVVSQPNTVSLDTSPPIKPSPTTPTVSQNSFSSSKPVTVPLPEEPVANQIMMQFVPGTTAEQKAAYIQSIGGQVSQNIDALNAVVVRVPDSKKALSASPLLKTSEPDYYAVAQVEPANDPFFPDQWALPVIHAPEGWATLTSNTPDVIVAVLDSGICADNVDLIGRVTAGWDFVQDDAAPQDEFGHGCSVAGVIAANGNNSVGIAGVAPNVKIMPIRVLDAQGIGTYSRVAAGITYAVDHGASIINLSLGGVSPSNTLQAAIDYAVAHHVMVIAAAGNTGNQTVLFPASYEPVIAVGSVGRNLQPSIFSSTGTGVDLYAPGEGIVSTSLDGFSTLSGTSLAAPQVAGVAALDMALGQTLKVDGGIVSVTGFTSAAPTPTLQPTATTNPIAVCNKPLADEAEAALQDAIHQRTLGTATDDDVHNAGQVYLAAAAGCFDLAYRDSFSIDDGGSSISGEVTDQFVFNNTKWGVGSTGVAGNPPGIPGGTVTYSFMPDGVDLKPGLPYEEGAVKTGDVVEALSSLPGNTPTCNLEARVEQVFTIWSAIANIDFVRVPDNGAPFNSPTGNVGDIRIGGHGIDGVGEQLAHAFFPPSAKDAESGSGDLHFDAAENWGCEPGVDAEGRQVVDIGLVALHEVGHAIGLNHVQIANALAVMNPTYNTAFVGASGPVLQSDDITGAKAIYGVRGFDAPAGLSPLNITQDNTPTFSWTAVASATQYQLQVNTGNTYQNPLLDQIVGQDSGTQPPAEFTLITPLVNGDYMWRVRAFNETAGGWGEWSANTQFTVRIGVPALLSPLNGEAVRAGQITFQWTTVFGDDPQFEWQLAKLPDFASINLIKSVTNLTQPVYTINLPDDGTYYWRARANGGDWSAVRSFSIASNAPVPLYPTGGIVLDTNQVTFEWTPVAGATEYQYQLDTSPNFVGLLYLDNLFLNKLFLNKLFLNKLFLNKLSEDPLFLNKLFGDDLFLNKLFSDPLFLNKLFLNKLLMDKLFLNKLFLNKLELGKPLSEGIHYWRVRAHLADGTWGEWSSPANFVVDTPRSNVVINEVQTSDPSWIELYNSGLQSVDLSTWQFLVYLPDGEATFAYSFPDGFVIQPGAYVTLHEANGTNTATDLYLGPNTIDWIIPDVGALSTDNAQVESSSIDLAPKSTPSDSASETPTVTAPVEEPVIVNTAVPSVPTASNTASQATNTNVAPSTNPDSVPISAQSLGSTDEGAVTAQAEDTVTAQDTFIINIGDTVSNNLPGVGAGNIETAGGNDVYTFTATAGQIAYFDALSGSGITWRLVNPSSTQVFNQNITLDGGRLVLVAGTYTLTVTANAGITGLYSFAIRTVAAPQTFTINVGDTVSNNVPNTGAGNIETPGAQDTYTFIGTAGQIVYFDGISTTDSLYWTLTSPANPTSTTIFDRYYVASDPGRQVLPSTGTYTITVASYTNANDDNGTYSFKLWNIPAPQTFTINVGDTVSNNSPGAGAGNIESPGAQDIYTFTGTAGQSLYFDGISATDSLYWTLTGPTSSIIFNRYSLQNSYGALQTLTATGTYTITVGAYGNTYDDSGTYSFKILTAQATQTFPIAIDDTVSDGVPGVGAGNIETPGAQDVYTFTGTAGQTLYFDAISATDSINWSLTTPTGTAIFDNYNLEYNDGGQQTLTATGTYTITVQSNLYGYTGTYSFKIWTVGAPQNFSIAVGDTVSDGVPGAGAGNIETPGAQDIYMFSGTSGQVLYFDAISASDSLYWTLTSPTSSTIFNNYNLQYSNGGQQTLPSIGTYTIKVNGGSSGNTGSYSFKIWTVPAPQTFSIAVGDTVSNGVPGAGAGNIESPGAQDIYTFSGTAGQKLFFDATSTNASYEIYWSLISPSTSTIFNTAITSDGGQQTLGETGTYSIKVYDGYGNGITGSYSFKIWTVPAPQTFSIAVGDTVSDGVPGAGAGNLESPGAQDIYTFSGTSGQKVYFDAITSSASYQMYWTLTSPSSATIFNTYINSDGGSFTLNETGTYTITVAPYNTTTAVTGTYSFKLWTVTPSQTFSIAVGDTVSDGVPGAGAGNIESPGTQDTYTFSGTTGQNIFFDGISFSGTLYWTLTSPSSVQIFNTYVSSDGGQRTLTETGTYTIKVSDPYDDGNTGAYSFKLWAVTAPQTFSIAVGDTVSDGVPGVGAGNLESPVAQDTYTFSGTAGQKVFFDGLASSTNYQIYWTLTSPSDVTIFNTYVNSDGGQFTLSETGTYTITVASSSYNPSIGTYSFKLWNIPTPQSFNIAVGDTVSDGVPAAGAGNLESPGAQDIYTFSGTTGQSIFFDGISNNSNYQIYWTLTSPSSVTLFNTYVYANGGKFTLTESGNYTIKVGASSSYPDATGTYSFKLWTVPASQSFSIAVGDTVSDGVPAAGAGNLESPGAQDTYTFSGTTGQSIFFDGIISNAGFGIYWTLTSPTNVTLFNTSVNSDGGQRTLSETGTYTIKVYDYYLSDYYNSGNTGSYSFRISTTSSTEFAIALGSTVAKDNPTTGAGNISSAGEVDTYVFGAQAGQSINLVAQTGTSSDLTWRLTAPNSTELFNTGYANQNNVALPVSGTYKLTVQASDSNPSFTGTYGFQLIPIVAPQTFAINIGNTISNGIPSIGAGNLELYGSQDVYTFTGAAGQTVFFDPVVDNTYDGYWKLTSPSSATLFDAYFSTGSSKWQVLPASGTYTLTFSDHSNRTGTYAFRLRDASAAQTYPISIGTTVSVNVPSAGAGIISVPGEQDIYTFSATAGQTVSFDGITNSQSSSYTAWRLTAPNNTTVFDQSMTSRNLPRVLAQAGTYTLTVYSYYGYTGTYGFKLWNAAAPQTFAVTVGDTISNGKPSAGAGNIEAIGSQDIYTFSATAGQVIHFDLLASTNSSIYWRLTSPTNSQIFDLSTNSDAGRRILTAAGTYTLTVYGTSNNTGTYSFKLRSGSAPQTFAINIGNTVSNGVPGVGAGNIETAGSEDAYTFNVTSGQKLYFEAMSDNPITLTWELHDPYDSISFKQSTLTSYGSYTFYSSGTYTLYVYGSNGETGTYGFKLWEVPAPQTFTINVGDVISKDIPAVGAGSLEAPGSEDVYTFALATQQTLYFDALAPLTYSIYWQLTNSNSPYSYIFSDDLSSDAGSYTLAAGTYSLRVYSYSNYRGNYSFRITPNSGDFVIAIGDTVSNGSPATGAGNIETTGNADIYVFVGTQGQYVTFDALTGSSSNLQWRLVGPSSSTPFNSSFSDQNAVLLSATGTYTLTVQASTSNPNFTGTYSFKLTENTVPTSYPISIGNTITQDVPGLGAGIIEKPGNIDTYTFNGAGGQLVNFDAITNNVTGSGNVLIWSLVDHTSTAVPGFTSQNFQDVNGVTLPLTDTYTLTVQTYFGTGTGNYSFRIVTVPRQTFSIAIGNTVSDGVPQAGAGNIETAGAQDLYTFNGIAGQAVNFDALTNNVTGGTLVWSLADHTGTTVSGFSSQNFQDLHNITLPSTDTYTLKVETESGTGTGTYSFRVSNVPGETFSIAIGDTVSDGVPGAGAGNIESAGNQDKYTFSGTSGQILYFDSLASSDGGNIIWELSDPSANVIFNLGTANDGGRKVLPATGTYTIRVYGRDTTIGTYSFIVRSVSDNTFSINVGDTVSDGVPGEGAGNIESPGNQDTYTFSGTAGQLVYLDNLSTTGGNNIVWELSDPSANVIFNLGSANDGGRQTLPITGTYTIRVYAGGVTTGTYSFKIWASTDDIFSIAIGDTVSTDVPEVGAGNIAIPGNQDVYTFTATTGQQVTFDSLSSSNAEIRWRVFDPSNTVIFDNGSLFDSNPLTLVAGIYTIRFYSNTGATGTYSFQILLVTGDESPQPGPTYTVNTTDIHDDGVCGTIDCSLIEAINASNALPNTNTITLGVVQTYTLTTAYLTQSAGLPEITTPIVIQANGSTIQRVALDTVPFRLFDVAAATRLTLNNVTLTGGYTEGGGALGNSGGAITIRNSTITGNRSSTVGGAYYAYTNGSTLTISNSTFSGNSGTVGGAIYSSGVSTITIDATTFSGNTTTGAAGAIYGDVGTTTIIRSGSVFTNNTSVQGAAIMNNGATSTLTITDSTISNNTSTSVTSSGAVDNRLGTVTITNTTFTNNKSAGFGGAIYNVDGATATIVASAFNTNSADQGGGAIYNDLNSTLTISSNPQTSAATTFTGNTTSSGAGGAIASIGSTVNISDAALTNNSAVAGNGGAISNGTGNVMTLTGVTLTTNTALSQGGAVSNLGNLTMDKTTFDQNSLSSGGSTGGAINSSGSLTITNSSFTGNSAGSGGALYQDVANATISGSTFTGSTASTNGGALLIAGGTTSISNSTFNGNTSTTGTGAGLFVNAGSTVTVTNTLFKENVANGVTGGTPQGGGAIGTLGTLTVNSTNFESNQGQNGGALLVLTDATATISSSAFNGNQALNGGSGGGIYSGQGSVSVTNTTFANNFAPGIGGAISTDSASGLTLTHVTIASNSVAGGSSGGGLYAAQGTVDIRNSIIANNAPDNCNVGTGNFTVTTSLQFPGPASCGSASVLDPQLSALKGSPAFFSLLPGSPAIDSASSTFCTPKDQRGIPRGVNSDGTLNSPAVGDCDIGAIELFTMNLGQAGPQVGTIGGGAALINVLTGEDFVQFGDTNLIPPQGTNWTGGTPELPDTGKTLGRDPSSSDTDDRTDWSQQDPTMGGQNGIKVVINEIFPGAVDAVELYNPSIETVKMDGWKLMTYNANGALEVNYTFGHFSLAPNAYVVLREGNGTNDAANIYLNTSISWADWNARGAVALTNGNGGVDFMRFGDSGSVTPQSENGPVAQATSIIVQPPDGTRWTGVSPVSPLPNQSLGRDSESTDVDDGNDWFTQAPSLGLQNPLVRPAVNDNFNDAIVVLRLPFRNTQTTVSTVRADATDPTPSCGFNVGHTIWYQYTAQSSGIVRFQTDGSDFNTVMAVYTNSASGLTQIACDDDSGEGQRSRIDLNMTAGTTYYFMIGGVDYTNGNAVFSGLPPVNDDFEDAINVTALPFSDSQNTTAAGLPFDDPTPNCGLSIGRSIWYSFTATSDARVVFRTIGSDFDTVLSVYTGTRGHLVEVGCNDDSGFSPTSSFNIRTIPGTTYYVMVAGNQGAGGNLVFTADLLPRPSNDFFATPTVISDPLPYSNKIDTTGATNEPFDRATLTCGINVGDTVWYSYTPSTDHTVIFSTSGSSFDTTLAVWTNINQPAIACNDDAPAGFYSTVTLNVIANTTYYIMVGGYSNTGGNLVFRAFSPAPPPANDERASAIEISPLPFTYTADVTGATNATDDPTPSCSIPLGTTVWFHLSPAAAATQLRLQTAGSDYDTVLAVFANVSGTLVELACNDDSQPGHQSLVVTNINANTDVYVMVGDFSGIGGNLVFAASTNGINQRPDNDVFDSATQISALPYNRVQSTLNATSAPDDPIPTCGLSAGSSVWYSFTATNNGLMRLQTAGSDFDTVLAVYTGTRGNLTEVACNDDTSTGLSSQIEFTTVSGTTYYVMVTGNGNVGGNLTFHAELFTMPANDDFDSATPVTLDSLNLYSATQSTSGSTSASDDPTTCNTTTANTVWYSFTAPSAGTLSVSTEGSNYNTVLSVYTGTRGSLTPVGCDDNSGANLTARLDNITVTANTTYFIMIGGAFGQTGSLALNVALLPAPANDDFDNAIAITALPYTNTQDTAGATVASDDLAACNATPAKTVWYSFTSTSANLLRLRLDGTTFNTVLAVYTGTRGSLTPVACQIGGGLDLVTTPTTTYFIMVGGYGGASGMLTIQASEVNRVANDDFDNAIDITALPYTNTQDTVGASAASDDPLTCTPSVGKSVWYRYTAPEDGTLKLDLTGTSFNTVLAIYTGTRGNLVPINCTMFAGTDITVTSGTTYYLMVSGFEGDSGSLVLSANLAGSITATITPNTPTVESGGSVTYTVRVTNTSSTDSITLNTLSDTLYGDLNGKGICVLPQTIVLGGFYECSFTTAITGNVGDVRTDILTASGKDQSDRTVSANASTTVTIVSGTPTLVANDDTYSTNEDTALTVAAPGVLLNDTGSILTATVVTNPVNGTLTLNTDGSFIYTPNANFNGADSFTYKANDGTTDSNSATVSITVNPVNDDPVAVDDSYATDEDTPLNIAAPGILTNDTDVDVGTTLTASLVTNPVNGTLTLNADGSFTYTPAANFNGADSFTYKANDGTTDSNIATVAITVNPVNDAPVAVILSPTAGNITADATGFASVVLNSSGTSDVEDSLAQLSFLWSWTENGNPVTIAAAGTAHNFPIGTYTITLKVTDSGSLFGTQSVVITVLPPPNQPPTVNAGADASITLPINNVTLVGTASDDGLPIGSTLTTTWSGPAGVTFANANALSTLATFAAPGSYTLMLTASDGAASVSDTVVITVNSAANNLPIITSPGNQSSNEGTVISLQIVASDPENTALTYAATGLPAGLSINPTTGLISGTLPFTAAGSYVVNLSVTDSGTPPLTASTSFNWSVIDVPQTGTAVISFTLLNGDTNLPIAGYDPLLTGSVINLATLPTTHLNIRANVSGTPIRSVVFGGTAGTIIDNSVPYALFGTNVGSTYVGSYTLSATPFSLVNGVGTAGQALSINFSVINQTVANNPPVLGDGQPTVTVNEGQTAVNSGSLSDADNDPLTLSASVGNVTRSGNTWNWSYLTTDGPANSQTVTISVSDGRGGTTQKTFALTVANVAPTATFSNTSGTIVAGSSAILSFTGVSDPSSADMSAVFAYRFDCTSDGIIDFNAPVPSQACSYPTAGNFTATGSIIDKDGGTATYTVGITVSPVTTNNPPIITTPAAQSSSEGAVISLQIVASDPENTALTYSATGLPTGLSINPTTGLISGTLPFTAAGNYVVNLSVTDSGTPPLTASTSFNWSVADVPQTGISVVSFTLLNADTNQPIAGYDPLITGTVINLATLPTSHLNIRANVADTPIGSVVFGGTVGTVIDNVAPYAPFGSNIGNTYVGSYILSATPFSLANGAGTAGQSLSIAFSVINQAAPAAPPAALAVTPPVAAFKADVVNGVAPLTVQFTNQSTGDNLSYSWNFGDGATSNEVNPTHSFVTAGSYSVTLTVSSTTGSNTSQIVIQVSEPLPPPEVTASPGG